MLRTRPSLGRTAVVRNNAGAHRGACHRSSGLLAAAWILRTGEKPHMMEDCMLPAKRRSVVSLGLGLSAVFILPVFLAAPSASQASPAESRSAVTDPTALKALARTAAYLRSLPGFRLHATVTDDEVVHGDFKLQRSAEVQVLVRRPDRMRADLSGDFGERLFVYDGKT